jgi:hypothetical protein
MPGTKLVYKEVSPVIPLKRTCKEVAALLIAGEDRELPLTDRLALRLHMVVCEACPRFQRQVITMRNGMQLWRNYTDSSELPDPNAPVTAISQKN